jgi:GNAT superfamily N-acetyltransferase
MVHADLIIRQAVPADAADIKALILMAMDVYARNSGIHTPLDAQLETLADHRAHIRADHVLVVEHHGRLIGTVRLVRGEAGTAFFSRFAVLPALQRAGVGKRLYQTAESWLRSQGIRVVILHTALSNPTLVKFYQDLGFRLCEENAARGYPRGTFCKELVE